MLALLISGLSGTQAEEPENLSIDTEIVEIIEKLSCSYTLDIFSHFQYGNYSCITSSNLILLDSNQKMFYSIEVFQGKSAYLCIARIGEKVYCAQYINPFEHTYNGAPESVFSHVDNGPSDRGLAFAICTSYYIDGYERIHEYAGVDLFFEEYRQHQNLIQTFRDFDWISCD